MRNIDSREINFNSAIYDFLVAHYPSQGSGWWTRCTKSAQWSNGAGQGQDDVGAKDGEGLREIRFEQ